MDKRGKRREIVFLDYLELASFTISGWWGAIAWRRSCWGMEGGVFMEVNGAIKEYHPILTSTNINTIKGLLHPLKTPPKWIMITNNLLILKDTIQRQNLNSFTSSLIQLHFPPSTPLFFIFYSSHQLTAKFLLFIQKFFLSSIPTLNCKSSEGKK